MDIRSAGVVGLGTMGAGIAEVLNPAPVMRLVEIVTTVLTE
jgi:3-hydroxyacyl-CoA dehydrogenase